MGYDIILWKQKGAPSPPDAVAYLMLAEGLPWNKIAAFPVYEVVGALRVDFGDAFDDYLQAFVDCRHLWATLSWNALLERDVARLRALATRFDLVLWDPQVTTPLEHEIERFRAAKARALADASHQMFDTWVELAASGDLTAMNELGNCYAFGDGVQLDDSIAVHWYRRAAAGGLGPAIVNLAECYRTGTGVARDPAMAIRLFTSAGDAGLTQAFIDLANHFRNGDGVPQDYRRAAALYERALTVEQCVSAFELGQMFERGEGVVRSVDRAEELYVLARSNRHPEAYRALKRLGRVHDE